ncbi:Dolichyl-phosphate-mannose--protein mannosyltransferase 4 [Dimargaris xerosporica]|nr:Dolichyl-phosphate-mannose--protein mannosyltransferase 4 [Dimargaris xerosporica]
MTDQTVRQRGHPGTTKVPAATLTDAKAKASVTTDTSARVVPKAVRQASHPSPSTIALAIVTVLSFATRFYGLWHPAQVVFDEVHFGKFASYYIRRTFFFDVHPPLAKMLIALQAYLVGMDGKYLFDKIGQDYAEHHVPYLAMRSLPAFLGSLLAPGCYLIMIESGYSVYAAFLAGMLIVFDNALVVHSRFILLDTFLLVFMLGAVLFYVRFFKTRYQAFSVRWWINLALAGLFLGLVVSVKLVGLLTIGMIGLAVVIDLWRLLDINRGLTIPQWSRHVAARAVCLIAVPIMVYVAAFYVHFAVLNRSGPGDHYFSPAFQGALLDNPLFANSLEVRYNHNITLRHKALNVFLHSHPDRYPLRYDDGRISSKGQQVTGYPHKDANNFWRIEPVANVTNDVTGYTEVVKNGDTIRLLHVQTNTYLMTHDVASPLTATNMEMTTVGNNSTKPRYDDTLWRLEIDRTSINRTHWMTEASNIRLIHVKQGVGVFAHNKKLPKWAFEQTEVNGSKKPKDEGNMWVASEIQGIDPEEAVAKAKHRQPQSISFLAKFIELNKVMINRNAALTKPHPYQSNAATWPFVLRGVSYWTSNKDRQQIYFMGHPTGWWMAFGALLAMSALLLANVLASRRGVEPSSQLIARHLERSGGFLLLGWAMHYIPFFLMGRSLFLHHYLPSLLFSYMVVGAVFQYAFITDYGRFALRTLTSRVRHLHVGLQAGIALALILVVHLAVFAYFSPLSYGSGMSVDQVLAHKWYSGWDLQYAKK